MVQSHMVIIIIISHQENVSRYRSMLHIEQEGAMKENQPSLFKTWLSFAKTQEINTDYLNLQSCTIVVDGVKGNFLKEFKLVSKYDLYF